MATNRRDFIRTTLAAGGAVGLGLVPSPGYSSPPPPRPPRPGRALRLLILGGTGFLGPHMVRYALERGHQVTTFTRGRTSPRLYSELFAQVEMLTGDRNDDLSALEGRTWDVCLDNNASTGRAPWWVESSAGLLRDAVERYYFVSTRSAYAGTDLVPMTAHAPLLTYETAGVDRGAESLPYGLAKAEAERRALGIFGSERTGIFRPGLIIGPGDTTDRFTYWPVRIERGGEVLVPGDGSDPVQIIDARDLVEWIVRMAEAGESGVYNCVGPRIPRPFAELVYGIRAVTTAETTFTWADTDWLLENRVRPYSDMPVWRPPRFGAGFARFDLTTEVEKGLTYRALAVTTADTLEYHHARPPEQQSPLRSGLSPEREGELLSAWHARPGAPSE